MFNKNKKVIEGIVRNMGAIVELSELIVSTLVQNRKRISMLEQPFAEEIRTCSKCGCLAGIKFMATDKNRNYFCEDCKPKKKPVPNNIKKPKKK